MRCTLLPEDGVEKSIDLTKDDQVGDNKYDKLCSGVYAFKPILLDRFHKGAVRFYLSLHTKFSTFPTPIVLTTETVDVSGKINDVLDHTYDQLADKLEEYEEWGWVIDQFLHLDLHFPTVVEPAGQALNGTL